VASIIFGPAPLHFPVPLPLRSHALTGRGSCRADPTLTYGTLWNSYRSGEICTIRRGYQCILNVHMKTYRFARDACIRHVLNFVPQTAGQRAQILLGLIPGLNFVPINLLISGPHRCKNLAPPVYTVHVLCTTVNWWICSVVWIDTNTRNRRVLIIVLQRWYGHVFKQGTNMIGWKMQCLGC